MIDNTNSRGALRSPLSASERDVWQARFNSLAIIRHLGATVDLTKEHCVGLEVTNPQLFHQGGVGTTAINGAIISGLMDCAASIIGITHFRGKKCGTVSLHVQFLAPLKFDAFRVEAWIVRKSRQLLYSQCEIRNHQNKITTIGTALIALADERISESLESSAGQGIWLNPAGMLQMSME